MVTRFEARKLQTEMRRELDAPSHTLMKCAAGMLFVTALVIAGSGSLKTPDAGTYATAQVPSR